MFSNEINIRHDGPLQTCPILEKPDKDSISRYIKMASFSYLLADTPKPATPLTLPPSSSTVVRASD